MLPYLLKRLLEAIPLLWVVATVCFLLLHFAPGGPFDQERALPPEIQAQIDKHYGLDLPLHEQYWNYMKRLLHGDLGPSYKYPDWNVNEIIADVLPYSIELGIYALSFALLFGISLGTVAAVRHNEFWDRFCMGISLLGISLPSFVIAPLLILLFSITLGWIDPSGWNDWTDKILPSITLGTFYAAYIARLTRSALLDVLRQDYIRAARAKGASNFRIFVVHGLSNAISPVIAYLGPACAGLITGSFVIETVFHIPGLGRFFVQGAFNRDYTLLIGVILCYASFLVVFNLIADVLLILINPKQRFKV